VRRIRETRERKEIWGEESFLGRRKFWGKKKTGRLERARERERDLWF
jgi:hypothetical protein